MALLLTACASKDETEKSTDESLEISSAETTAEQANPQKKYEFSFWYTGDDKVVDDIIDLDAAPEYASHPCGAVHYMQVSSIPDFDGDPGHAADLVIEYGPRGNKIRQWHLPVDERIMGVADDLLLIDYEAGKLLGINTDGSIVETDFKSSDEDFGHEKCPAQMEKAFAPSGYLWCSTMKDAANGSSRKLAFEGPCT